MTANNVNGCWVLTQTVNNPVTISSYVFYEFRDGRNPVPHTTALEHISDCTYDIFFLHSMLRTVIIAAPPTADPEETKMILLL